jgi:hypothetical protein
MMALMLTAMFAAAPAVVADSAVAAVASLAGTATDASGEAPAVPAGGRTRAEPSAFVPSLALGLGRTPETLMLSFDDGREEARRSLWHTGVGLGLGYGLGALGPGRLRGHTELRLDVMLEDARLPLGLAQQVLWEYRLGRSMALLGGAHAGVTMEPDAPSRVHLDLGVPLGLRWRALELLLVPRVGLPLGAAEREVLGGTRAHRTGAGLALAHVTLRIHVKALGW